MLCPKCNIELVEGKTIKQKDGTVYTKFRCNKCNQRFMDIKMPFSAMANPSDD